MSAGYQRFRLAEGGLIDRTRPLSFTFNGRHLTGYAGDTLASALMANGIDVVARSFKYHRPRGVMTDGPEEPNAVVTVGEGPLRTPNLKATEVLLSDGLAAQSQNCWPSVDRDLGAIAGLAAPLLGAGFYYKTFMAPRAAWPLLYERLIRHAAGMGKAPEGPDTGAYEHKHVTCDVLVIGAGPAGLMAARNLVQAGLRLILCDERPRPGGALTGTLDAIDGEPGATWAARVADDLAAMPSASVLADTTAVWLGDHRLVTLVERRSHGAERLWLVRPRHIVLATGAIERPLCFPGNDRPGVMLASALGAYVHRYGVAPGRRAVLHANNDSGYASLEALRHAGITVAGVVDLRPREMIGKAALEKARGLDILDGHRVAATAGRHRLHHVNVARLDDDRTAERFEADLLCLAGGWSPTLHLLAHRGVAMRYDRQRAAYVADAPGDDVTVAGAAAGVAGLADCLADGAKAAVATLGVLGRGARPPETPEVAAETGLPPGGIGGPWCSARTGKRRRKAFVDFQNDVTAGDLASAVDEGYGAIEHLKRYTTAGMGTDQGKLGNVVAIGVVAELTGHPIDQVGHTTFRPPYTPVTLGALVGHAKSEHLFATRQTPFHDRHLAAGALMELSGAWHYPKCYPRDGETIDAAIAREVSAVRSRVGFVDMSTLGKVELYGPDAGQFLDRVYANRLSSLAEGRCRYALMLREDGVVYDDGTVTRMAKDRWHITASTAHADGVVRHLQRLHQVEWPNLDVALLDVTEQWAGLALAGPAARDVLSQLLPELDTSQAALPFLGYRETSLGGQVLRIFRISYSGELAFEIYIGAHYAGALWDAVVAAGRSHGITPYGVEALDVMRIEKGHVAGSEIDGHTTPGDLGLGRMVKRDTPFLGSALLNRSGVSEATCHVLVGLVSADGRTAIPRGALLVAETARSQALGHVTASVFSPTLDKPIALAMLSNAETHDTARLRAVSPSAGLDVAVTLAAMPFYDAAGERMRA